MRISAWISDVCASDLAIVNFMRASRGVIERISPFSIGLGGASFGRNVGVGAGLSVPIGKRRTRELIVSELSVQIKRRADGTVILAGRGREGRRVGKECGSSVQSRWTPDKEKKN